MELFFTSILSILMFILGIIFFFNKVNTKYNAIGSLSKRNELLKELPKIKIPLEDIKVNGLHWQQNMPVDIYNNEVDSNDPNFYGLSDFSSFNGTFYKDKSSTKFISKLYIEIPYLNAKYKFQITIPVDHTIVNMEFFIKKSMTVSVEEFNDKEMKKVRFWLDFRFLEDLNKSFIASDFFEVD